MTKKKRAPQTYRSPGVRPPTPRGGPTDMMSQLQQMQEQMMATQASLGDEVVEVSVGGGVVTVVATGQQEIRSIVIQPEVVDPDDVEMLQDLVLSAVNEALEQSRQLANDRMGGLTQGLNIPPGLL